MKNFIRCFCLMICVFVMFVFFVSNIQAKGDGNKFTFVPKNEKEPIETRIDILKDILDLEKEEVVLLKEIRDLLKEQSLNK